jgi:hypothetical protein
MMNVKYEVDGLYLFRGADGSASRAAGRMPLTYGVIVLEGVKVLT